MRYSDLIITECYNGPGWGDTFSLQGCHKHCKGCFNPETWDFLKGKEFTPIILEKLIENMSFPYITRLSIQGGEPLCLENISLTYLVCKAVKEKYPNKKIYIWTGYLIEDLLKIDNKELQEILSGKYADVLIDGPFIEEQKDLTLFMRGSKNQRIIELPFKQY